MRAIVVVRVQTQSVELFKIARSRNFKPKNRPKTKLNGRVYLRSLFPALCRLVPIPSCSLTPNKTRSYSRINLHRSLVPRPSHAILLGHLATLSIESVVLRTHLACWTLGTRLWCSVQPPPLAVKIRPPIFRISDLIQVRTRLAHK